MSDELPAIAEEEIFEWPSELDYLPSLSNRERLLRESDVLVRGLASMVQQATTELGFVKAQIDRLTHRRNDLMLTWDKRITRAKHLLEQRHRALVDIKLLSRTWDTGTGKASLRIPNRNKPTYKLEYTNEAALLAWCIESAGSLLTYSLAKKQIQKAAKHSWKVKDGLFVTVDGEVVPGVQAVVAEGSWSYTVGALELEAGEDDDD